MTPTSVQANHTSAVGQVEAVNFTIIPTGMADGCHIQVRQTGVTGWLITMEVKLIEMRLLNLLHKMSRLRVLPCLRPGSASSITAPTTATFATSWKVGARLQTRVHADWQWLSVSCPRRKWTHQRAGFCWIHQRVAVSGIRPDCLQVVSSATTSVFVSLTPKKSF